ncbi:MAG: flagellar assembly protein FliW [Acidimicrobiales bacterium]
MSEADIPELNFPDGLMGFPDAKRFTLLAWGGEGSPFSLLHSLEDETLEFVVVPPLLFFPDYEPEIDDESAARLELTTTDDAITLVIVTVPDDPKGATANLLGPVIVNRHTLKAGQVVLSLPDDFIRRPLLAS